MNVGFGMRRCIVADNTVHVFDIETSCHHIRCHQYTTTSASVPVKGWQERKENRLYGCLNLLSDFLNAFLDRSPQPSTTLSFKNPTFFSISVSLVTDTVTVKTDGHTSHFWLMSVVEQKTMIREFGD